jgi:hypothetical protein
MKYDPQLPGFTAEAALCHSLQAQSVDTRIAPMQQGAHPQFWGCDLLCDAGLAACLAATSGVGSVACYAAAAACHAAC